MGTVATGVSVGKTAKAGYKPSLHCAACGAQVAVLTPLGELAGARHPMASHVCRAVPSPSVTGGLARDLSVSAEAREMGFTAEAAKILDAARFARWVAGLEASP